MKRKHLLLLFIPLILSACAPRNVTQSVSESSSQASSVVSAIESKELSSLPESVTSALPIPEPEEEPVPVLTDTEKNLLTGNLSLFAHFIGASETNSSALSKNIVLGAAIAEIERTKDLNAYFFEQDDKKNDLIPAAMLTDKALQLFGLEDFDATDIESYDSESKCYVGKQTDIPGVTASDIKGAASGNVAYIVTFPDGDYKYTCKILRQNGMPYLRFVSAEKSVI